MSLLQPTVYSPLIPCSADIVECVFGVKSDSVQLMLVWERGGGHEGVGQNDDQSRRCPFLLITHYCATDSCQNGSTAEMCTKASINQEGYSSVWSSNPTPHLFLLPVCLTAGCTGQLELRSCQPDCSWNEWMPHSTMTACTFHKILTAHIEVLSNKSWIHNLQCYTYCSMSSSYKVNSHKFHAISRSKINIIICWIWLVTLCVFCSHLPYYT